MKEDYMEMARQANDNLIMYKVAQEQVDFLEWCIDRLGLVYQVKSNWNQQYETSTGKKVPHKWQTEK
jgi:hypothetical protein